MPATPTGHARSARTRGRHPYGLAFAQGLQAGGVIPVVKHFPGLGRPAPTPISARPRSPDKHAESRCAAALQGRGQAGLPAVMVGNATVPGLTSGPATLSSAAVTGLLRGPRVPWPGADRLAVRGRHPAGRLRHPAAAVRAIEAGADMVMFDASNPPLTTSEIIASLVSAVRSGQLPVARLDSAVQHVLQVKGRPVCG